MVAQTGDMIARLTGDGGAWEEGWAAPWETEVVDDGARLREEDARWVQQLYDGVHAPARRWKTHHARGAEHAVIWRGDMVGKAEVPGEGRRPGCAQPSARSAKSGSRGAGATYAGRKRTGRSPDAGEGPEHVTSGTGERAQCSQQQQKAGRQKHAGSSNERGGDNEGRGSGATMTGHDGAQMSKRACTRMCVGAEMGRPQTAEQGAAQSQGGTHDTRERNEAREESRSRDGARGDNVPASQQRGATGPTRKRALSSSDATPTRPASKPSLQKSSDETDGKRPKPTDREVGRDVKRKRDDAEAGRDSPPQTHPPTHSPTPRL